MTKRRVVVMWRYLIVLARRVKHLGYQYRYPLKWLGVRLLLTALVLGLVIAFLGWGRAHPHWYDPFRSREDRERAGNFFSWVPPWEGW